MVWKCEVVCSLEAGKYFHIYSIHYICPFVSIFLFDCLKDHCMANAMPCNGLSFISFNSLGHVNVALKQNLKILAVCRAIDSQQLQKLQEKSVGAVGSYFKFKKCQYCVALEWIFGVDRYAFGFRKHQLDDPYIVASGLIWESQISQMTKQGSHELF